MFKRLLRSFTPAIQQIQLLRFSVITIAKDLREAGKAVYVSISAAEIVATSLLRDEEPDVAGH